MHRGLECRSAVDITGHQPIVAALRVVGVTGPAPRRRPQAGIRAEPWERGGLLAARHPSASRSASGGAAPPIPPPDPGPTDQPRRSRWSARRAFAQVRHHELKRLPNPPDRHPAMAARPPPGQRRTLAASTASSTHARAPRVSSSKSGRNWPTSNELHKCWVVFGRVRAIFPDKMEHPGEHSSQSPDGVGSSSLGRKLTTMVRLHQTWSNARMKPSTNID